MMMNDDECGAIGEMLCRGNQNTEKTYHIAALSTTNPT
jgi:hypothetical protein